MIRHGMCKIHISFQDNNNNKDNGTPTLKATTTKTITFKAPTNKKCADMREGNPGDATHRFLSLTISHQMEIGPTVFLLSD